MASAWLVDATRTPFGRLGGALAGVRADDLAALPISALMARHPSLDWAALDEVILGCANQSGEDNRNVARMASLLAGLPQGIPAVTVNRLCASGLESIGQAARAIACGEADLIVAGGVESMTRAPYVMAKAGVAWAREQKLDVGQCACLVARGRCSIDLMGLRQKLGLVEQHLAFIVLELDEGIPDGQVHRVPTGLEL